MIEFDFSNIFSYIAGDSIIHKLDPRIKIILFFFIITISFIFSKIYSLLLLILFVLVFILFSKISLIHFIKPLKSIMILLFITLLLNIFFISNGKVIFSYKFINITDKGLQISLVLFLRLLIVILYTFLLTLTTSMVKLTYAIEFFLTKLGKWIHPYEVSLIISIAIRFMPVLIKDFMQILKAQVSRGANIYTSSFFERIKILVSIIVPLLLKAFMRAENLAIAMEVRGFGLTDHSKYLNRHKFQILDFFVLFISMIYLLFTVYFNFFILKKSF